MARKKQGNSNSKYLTIIIIVAIILVAPIFLFWLKHALTQKDKWCTTEHVTSMAIVSNPKTATDYYNRGNYNFDTGNCEAAIIDFNKSLELNPKFAEGFNNRAYTYMRMGEYQNALSDLNMAIELRPNYINALMNRGDIYNFYMMNYPKALNDYKKVVELGGTYNTSVCGHMMIARDQGWHVNTVFQIIDHIWGAIVHLDNIRLAGC